MDVEVDSSYSNNGDNLKFKDDIVFQMCSHSGVLLCSPTIMAECVPYTKYTTDLVKTDKK